MALSLWQTVLPAKWMHSLARLFQLFSESPECVDSNAAAARGCCPYARDLPLHDMLYPHVKWVPVPGEISGDTGENTRHGGHDESLYKQLIYSPT